MPTATCKAENVYRIDIGSEMDCPANRAIPGQLLSYLLEVYSRVCGEYMTKLGGADTYNSVSKGSVGSDCEERYENSNPFTSTHLSEGKFAHYLEV